MTRQDLSKARNPDARAVDGEKAAPPKHWSEDARPGHPNRAELRRARIAAGMIARGAS